MPRVTPLTVVKTILVIIVLISVYFYLKTHTSATDEGVFSRKLGLLPKAGVSDGDKTSRCTDIPNDPDAKPNAKNYQNRVLPIDGCPARLFYSATSDIQMLEAYDVIPFDNRYGGVWTQGFDIQYDRKAVQKEEKLQVIVVPHSHDDPGWLWTFDEYIQPVANILNNMLAYLTKYPDMKFIYAEMSFFEAWWSKLSDASRTAVKKLINNGQLEIVTGAWVMTDEANSHYYATIMEMIEGHEFLVNQLDYRPSNHWSIDPFGLSPTLSYIVKAGNLSHMAVQRVHYSVKKYLAQNKNLEFVWRQLWAGNDDKTDIFTHLFPFFSYNIRYTCGPDPTICRKFDFREAVDGFEYPWSTEARIITPSNVAWKARQLADQYRKKAQLFKTKVLLVPLGDDFRYWGDEFEMQHTNYAKLFESINNNAKYNMHVQFGTLKDYFALLDKHRAEEPQVPEFSTLSGDFFTYADRDDHYWSGYFTSRPFYKHMDRSLGHYLRSADLAFTLALIKSGNSTEKWAGIGEYDQLVEARRTLSLFQHHDGVTGTSVEYVVKDYARKLFVALFQCRNIIASATEYLLNMPNSALSVDEEHKVDVLPRKATVGSDAMVVVQNSLGYQREEVVCVQVNTTKTRVTKAGSDDAILQQIEPIVTADGKGGIGLSRDQFQLCFVASTPSFGFSRYELRHSEDSAPLATLKSSFKLESGIFKTKSFKTDDMQLSNGLITAKFNARTGFLASIQTADASMTVDMSFVYYGARPHKYYFDFGGDHRSGAYLFLPDGDARPLPTDKNTFVVISGPVRQTIIVKGPDEIKMLQHVSLDINTAHLNIRNLVDIRSQGNFEAAMRLKTGIVENDRFYTELNGYQLIRRKHFAKLPLQAHFFPMPGAAFIEDSAHRLTLLGRQALGVASLRPGWMEVILDRRLDQHDWRGMSEPVHDNLQTESNFRLVLETVDGPPPDAEPTTAYHSLANSILAAQIHYPPIVMIANRLDSATSAKVPSEVAGLAKPLPCDVHAVALRTLSQPTKYASNGHRKTEPDYSAALVLHRFGVECRIQTKLPVSCSQISSNNTIDIRSHFNDPILRVQPASLTLLYTNNHTDLTHLEILPMELKTVKIKF